MPRHTFTDDEKASYIEAELCLWEKEATLGLDGPKNRFEELQAAHQIQAGIVHGVVCLYPGRRLARRPLVALAEAVSIIGRLPPLPQAPHACPRKTTPRRVWLRGNSAVGTRPLNPPSPCKHHPHQSLGTGTKQRKPAALTPPTSSIPSLASAATAWATRAASPTGRSRNTPIASVRGTC